MNKLFDYYKKCLYAKYITTEEDGDYAIEKDGNTLYLMFQCTSTIKDWINNFDFPATPYKDMGISWKCHRGFLKVWKSMEDEIKPSIMDAEIKKVIIIGYSHGAALATLAHEYVWFNRPDLRENLEGYGYGCPRCYWGFAVKKELKERWQTFLPIANLNDIVPHLPPRFVGYTHVNKVKAIGKELLIRPFGLSFIDAHYPENYLHSLLEEETEDDKIV